MSYYSSPVSEYHLESPHVQLSCWDQRKLLMLILSLWFTRCMNTDHVYIVLSLCATNYKIEDILTNNIMAGDIIMLSIYYPADCISDNPCMNGGVCSVSANTASFTCACSEGYTGDLCDTGDVYLTNNWKFYKLQCNEMVILWISLSR